MPWMKWNLCAYIVPLIGKQREPWAELLGYDCILKKGPKQDISNLTLFRLSNCVTIC